MTHHLKQSFKIILTKSAIPLGVSLGCFAIEKVLSIPTPSFFENDTSQPSKTFEELLNFDEGYHQFGSLMMILSRQIRKAIMNSYHNLFEFLVMMFIFNILAGMITLPMRRKKEINQDLSNSEKTIEAVFKKSSKNMISSFGKNLIYFTICFLLCNLIVSGMNSSESVQFLSKETSDDSWKNSLSAYEEETPLIGRKLLSITPKPIEITTTIRKKAFHSILSQDGQTLYLNDMSSLQILDLKKTEEPKPVASLDFLENRYTALALTNNGKTIIVAGTENIELIDVSDHSSPSYISKPSIISSSSLDELASVAISRDDKLVYLASNKGFKIFDISDPSSISLVYSQEKFTKLALSPDNQKLVLIAEKEIHLFNVATLPKAPEFISTTTLNGEITSALFSPNSKIVYCSTISQKVSLQFLDVSNPSSLSIKNSLSLMAKDEQCDDPFLSPTPDSELIFITYCRTAQAIDVISLKKFPQVLGSNYGLIRSVLVPKGNKFAIFGCPKQIVIAKLYIKNIEGFQTFTLMPRLVAEVEDSDPASPLAISKDFKNGFFVGSRAFNPTLYVYDITDLQNSELLSETSLKSHTNSKTYNQVIPGSSNLIYIDRTDGIEIMDVSDLTSPVHKEFIQSINTQSFAVAPNEKSLFIIGKSSSNLLELRIIDISQLSAADILATVTLPKTTSKKISPKIQVSKNAKTLFYYNEDLYIFDISNLKSPVQISKVSLGSQLKGSNIALTPDEKAILVDVCTSSSESVEVINIENLKAPSQVGSVELPWKPAFSTFIEISSSGKAAFLNSEEGVLILDILSLETPFIVGQTIQDVTSTGLRLSQDQKNLFVTTPFGFSIYNYQPQSSLYTENLNYGLGGSYSNSLKVIKINEQNKYNLIEENYVFTSLSLYNNEFSAATNEGTVSYSPLPNCMSFDTEKGILKVTPKSEADINTYNIYARISTHISKDEFAKVTTDDQAHELLVSLTALGYINTEGYLTSIFNPSQSLVLSQPYAQVEKEKEIRDILAAHQIEMVLQVYIQPTLKIRAIEIDDETEYFEIETLATSNLHVQIRLEDKIHAQFLTRTYSGVQSQITDENTFLILNGDLTSINLALQAITVDVKTSYKSSSTASIFVSDNLNPSISKSFTDSAKYFVHNQPPYYNKQEFDLQTQIDRYTVFTGQNFVIEIDSQTFKNTHNLPLTISTRMADPKKEYPSWLLKKELKLIGTPPNKLSPNKFNLIMKVSNEYKSIDVPFTLSVSISLMYALSLAGVYSGYLLTIIGLWATSNKIFNVAFKHWYRYPKNFKVTVGEEVTDQTIPPIAFIADQTLESQFILRRLIKQMNEKNGIPALNETLWVKEFIDTRTQQINTQLLLEAVENVVKMMTVAERGKVKRFNSAESFQHDLIFQLIYHKAVYAQLNLEHEKDTKEAYEKIKSKWVNFISHNQFSQLQLDRACLEKELRRKGISIEKDNSIEENSTYSEEPSSTKNRSFEKVLLTSERSSIAFEAKQRLAVNMELLEKALIAHATSFHHLDARPIDIDILSLQKLTSSSPILEIIFQFLKMDLRALSFMNKREVGGGIKHRIKNDTLHFYGVPNRDIRDQVLVVQIVNQKRRNLRELWIYGMEEGPEGKKLMHQVNEEL